MKKNIKTIEELELEVLKSAENMNKLMGKMFLWGFVFVFLVIGIAIWLGLNNKKLNIPENLFNYIFLFLIIVAIIICIIHFILKTTKKNSSNRTTLIINTNKLPEELQVVMSNVINQLYYKEKKYYDELVYYSYKSENNGANINSMPRYLKYIINNNSVEIETWFVSGNKEHPIDSKSYGLYIKEAMLHDLKRINLSLANSNISKTNE